MHLGIDIREACRPRRAGKGQWTYGFVRELLTRDLRLTLFTDADLPAEWNETINARNDSVHVVRPDATGLKWHMKTAEIACGLDIDAYVSTVSYIVPFFLGTKKRVIPVVHDLIAFRNEPHDRRATLIERLTLGYAVRKAWKICAVSDTTKEDLLKRFAAIDPAKVVPIYAAPMLEPVREKKGDNIILCIATLCPRKNQLGLIRAFAQLPRELRDKHPLVLVGGRGWDDDEIVSMAQSVEGVRWMKYLSDEECRALYANAIVFAYPSFYEGFGMPVLDAFASGIPVLTSDIGSLKEVAGNAALTVDPADTAAITVGLEKLLTDPVYRETLRKEGFGRLEAFSWKQTADRFLAAVDKAV